MDRDIKHIRLSIRRKIKEDTKTIFHVKSLSNLDSNFINSIKPAVLSDKHHWKDCVYYIIHLIIEKSQNEGFKPGTKYVPLKYDILKEVMGDETTIVIQTLIKNKVIQRDEKFAIGRKPIGYKINPKFAVKGTLVFKTLASGSRVESQWFKQRIKYYDEQEDLLYQYAHIVKWLLDGNLIFLNSFAHEYIDILKSGVYQFFKRHYANLSSSKINMMLEEANFWTNSNTQDEIVKIKELPKVSKNGHRIYSLVTAMYSPLRNLLLYNNLPMVYIDISNSQPFHLLAMFQSTFWKEPESNTTLCLKNINKELYEEIQKKHKEQMERTIMTLKNHELKSPHGFKGPKNVVFRKYTLDRTFSYLVMNGKLYKFIEDNFSGKFIDKGVDPFADEKSSKKAFISMLYAANKNDYTKHTKYFKHFTTLFPFEAEIINLLKIRDYRDFSIMLQHIESYILLQGVCKDLYDKNPSLPIFTIHDGILSPIYYKNEIEDAITNVYKKMIGVSPECKDEYLRPSKLNFNKYKESLIKKAQKISENNGLKWVEPTPDFYIQLYKPYNSFYDRTKNIPQTWFDDIS